LMDQAKLPVLPPMSQDYQLGERTYALRQTYEYIRDHFPDNVVIQFNPRVMWNSTERYNGLYGYRQVAAADFQSGIVYAVSEDNYNKAAQPVLEIFEQQITVREIQRTCRTLAIDLLIVKDTDPIWHNPENWVWQQQPVYQNRFSRVFVCQSLTPTETF